MVDHSGVRKRLLKLFRLRVDAIEDGDLRGFYALVEQGQYLARNFLGFYFLRFISLKGGLWAGLAHALQLQPGTCGTAAGLCNDLISQLRNLRRGAVVSLQFDHGGLRVRAGEVQQVLR